MPTPSDSPAIPSSKRESVPTLHPIDFVMLALAVVSVGLLVWDTWWKLSPLEAHWITVSDYAICAVFLAEFLWRWRGDDWRRRYLWRNWYDILGMIPAASPVLRSFRLFRVFRMVILLSRFGRATDRAVGEEFTYRLVQRFKHIIVDAISDTLTVAMFDEVNAVIKKGTYTHNVARALDENREELRDMIREKLRQDPRAGRLKRLPFYNEIVEAVIDSGLHVVGEVLHDPRTDELVSDMLRENLQQIQAAILHNNRQK